MSLIENHILETQKKVNLLFDALLEKVRGNVEFLDEMNATNAQYDVAYVATQPETPCDIPAPEDLPEQVDEKLENKDEPPADLETIERDSEKFLALIDFSMFKGWQKSNVDNFLITKGLKLSTKNEEHLQELRKFAAMVKANEMDVPTLLDQSCLSKAEVSLLTAKYIF